MKLNLQLVAALVFTFALSANATDLAVLRNGNTIPHERREVKGALTRLYTNASGNNYIEIPTSEIVRFDKDPDPPQAALSPASQQLAPAVRAQHEPQLTRDQLNQVVAGAGARHQIDPDFINSVIHAESGFHQNAVSNKGAQGLMQLMPGTASKLGVSNPFDPQANVEGGTKYLRELLEKYNYDVPKALAAYNAGPGRVDRYRGIPPYYETQLYVNRIITDFNRKKLAENPALAKKVKARASRTSQARKGSARQLKARSSKPTAVTGGPETASR